jgi:hypothetical protein
MRPPGMGGIVTDVDTFFKPDPEPKSKQSARVRAFNAEFQWMKRNVIHPRSGGRCEVRIPGICTGTAESTHHRKPRKQGGLNTEWNLVDVCGDGVRGCHGYIERNRERAYANGWLVHSWDDPHLVRMVTF